MEFPAHTTRSVLEPAERPGYLTSAVASTASFRAGQSQFCRSQTAAYSLCGRNGRRVYPADQHECAGLVLIQNNDFHFRFVVTLEDESVILRLIRRTGGAEEILAQRSFSSGLVYLRVEAREQDYSFYAAASPTEWQPIVEASRRPRSEYTNRRRFCWLLHRHVCQQQWEAKFKPGSLRLV